MRTAKYNLVEFGLFLYKTRILDKFLYGFLIVLVSNPFKNLIFKMNFYLDYVFFFFTFKKQSQVYVFIYSIIILNVLE